MNALIQITTDAQGTSVVSARELHGFLAIKKQFADWIKHRVEKYGLVEGQDFTTYSPDSEKGRPTLEYALTLDAAKELAMVEGNEQGKVARQYFIECEKQLRQIAQPRIETAPVQLSRKELALMVIQIEEEKERLEKELAAAQPKVDYVDEVLDTTDCVVTTIVASELGYTAAVFNRLLKERGIQWKVNGVWVLTSKYAGKGYTQMRTHTYHDNKGERHASVYMVWTQRGRALLHYLFREQRQKQLQAAG
ncbi:phage antirepressor KilAC domain-containing protein [Fibrella sp. ES10-3-2-2]|nr:hypothetical protein A6C57_23375 [Fibrella sp. ES10-3-2-2]